MRKKTACIALTAVMAASMLTGCRESPVLEEMKDIYYSSASSEGSEDSAISSAEIEDEVQENEEDVTVSAADLQSFTYNGVEYTFPVNSTVFTDDGWTSDFESTGYSMPSTDGETGYVIMKNEKYDGLQARFYTQYEDTADMEDLEAEITANGVGGFYINVLGAAGTLPDISVGGITWKSSMAEVEDVFGTPTYADSNADNKAYYYEVSGEDGKDYTLMFMADGNGVYTIMLKNQISAAE